MYDELIEWMRYCADDKPICEEMQDCPFYDESENNSAYYLCGERMLKKAADAIEELSLLVKQLQKTHDDRIDFLEFLFNHIQPNEMEHYQTMYHCLDVPTCGESEGE